MGNCESCNVCCCDPVGTCRGEYDSIARDNSKSKSPVPGIKVKETSQLRKTRKVSDIFSSLFATPDKATPDKANLDKVNPDQNRARAIKNFNTEAEQGDVCVENKLGDLRCGEDVDMSDIDEESLAPKPEKWMYRELDDNALSRVPKYPCFEYLYLEKVVGEGSYAKVIHTKNAAGRAVAVRVCRYTKEADEILSDFLSMQGDFASYLPPWKFQQAKKKELDFQISSIREGLLQEIRVLRKLSTASVCPEVYDIFLTPKRFVVVMQMYDCDLDGLLSHNPELLQRDNWYVWAPQVMQTISALSQQDVQQLDMKPSNFVVDIVSQQKVVIKAIDFSSDWTYQHKNIRPLSTLVMLLMFACVAHSRNHLDLCKGPFEHHLLHMMRQKPLREELESFFSMQYYVEDSNRICIDAKKLISHYVGWKEFVKLYKSLRRQCVF